LAGNRPFRAGLRRAGSLPLGIPETLDIAGLTADITVMTLLKIARMGHPVLIRKAEEVADPTAKEIRTLVDDMVATMDDAGGVGLAAPQVHIGKRVIIISSPRERGDSEDDETAFAPVTALINPVYEPLSEETALGWEGCLSIPGLMGAVPRYTQIRYSGFSPRGQRIERVASGFHARVVQHEVDHLDGVLYTMRMPDLKLLAFSDEMKHFMAHDEDDEPAEDA
jgi:peptide deformylase